MRHRDTHHNIYAGALSAGLVLLAACTADDEVSPATPCGDAVLTFGAAVNAAATRAVADGGAAEASADPNAGTGILNYSLLANHYAIGVFAYAGQGDASATDGGVSAMPWPWHNQPLTYVGKDPADELGSVHEHTANWSYGADEIIWGKQVVSFLAYAPWVETTSDASAGASSSATDGSGITAVTADGVDETTVGYAVATDVTQGVDLLWGVREDANREKKKRLPWLRTAVTDGQDVLNPTSGGVTFSLHHALTAIGFNVQVMIDRTNDRDDYEDESAVDGILATIVDGKTQGDYKVTLGQVSLKGTFYRTGVLNLNNVTSGVPRWESRSGKKDEMTLTVAGEQINPGFRHPSASGGAGESSADLSDVAKSVMEDNALTGITQAAEQRVIVPKTYPSPTADASEASAEQCFFVIPDDGTPAASAATSPYELTILWYVSCRRQTGTDAAEKPEYEYLLERHENTLTISDWELKPETKYYLNLVIGLKSVRLHVTAADWTDVQLDVKDTFEHGTSANESL